MKNPWRLPGGQHPEWEAFEEQGPRKKRRHCRDSKQQGQKAEKQDHSLLRNFTRYSFPVNITQGNYSKCTPALQASRWQYLGQCCAHKGCNNHHQVMVKIKPLELNRIKNYWAFQLISSLLQNSPLSSILAICPASLCSQEGDAFAALFIGLVKIGIKLSWEVPYWLFF